MLPFIINVPGFHCQVALVTGGSSGLGAAVARQLAARGCRVASTGRDTGKIFL